jgi:hypothetical protein
LATTTPNLVEIQWARSRTRDAKGVRSYQASVDLDLKPGDMVKVDGEQLEVDQISYVIGPRSEFMQFQEALEV